MATATKVQIKRDDAVNVLVHCGWALSGKKNNDYLVEHLAQVKDVLPEKKPGDEATNAALLEVLAGIEAGAEFEIVGGEGPAPKAAKVEKVELTDEQKAAKKAEAEAAKAKKEQEKQAEKEAKAKAKEEEKAKVKAEKEAAKAAKKAEADAKKAAAQAHKGPPGLRPTRSRIYLAAQVIKKYGHEKGVTDEMVAEVDALSGKPNLKESKAWAGIAWHALNGFLGTFPCEDEAPKAS